MRDLVLTALILGALPFILWRPHIGVLLWTWLSIMNPHRLTWSYAYDMPFAFIVALVTLVALVLTREPKKVPWTAETVILLVFIGWMVLTTLFATYPKDAWPQLEKVLKIMLMVYVTMMLMQSKLRINLLMWVMVLSLAFYGVKGGLFTLRSGGVHAVWGPAGSFITGNNEMALALIMTIPLLRYLQLAATKQWIKHAMTAAMILTALAAIGSQSRGALIGIVTMAGIFWAKSRSKLFTATLVITAAVIVLAIMPEQWFDRMATIRNYEQDGSAMRRINAWKTAINVAVHKPLGGGFEVFQPATFAAYSGGQLHYADAHSIYFEVLGEHGFVGLALFLALAASAWLSASRIIRRARDDPHNRWMADLCRMVQVSMLGYASAGAFLGLAYFDLYYNLIAVVVVCKVLLRKQEEQARLAHVAQRAPAGLAAAAARPG